MEAERKPIHPPLEASSWSVARGWKRLEDLCEGVFDCPHSTPELANSGPLVVRSQDIRSGVFRTEGAACVTEETYSERIARAEPRFGDILYSREGTYFGIAAEMPKNHRVCLGQRMVLIRPKAGLLNTRFLRFWLNSPILSRHLHGFRDGTVAERLNMPTIRALPIPDFAREEQDKIAALLGALDDKIELNRRMNETLEAVAQAVFRDWFVDFGPTRAKMEGREPYLAPDLWALFPDKLDVEGKPEGWDICRVDDILELAYGKALTAQDRIPGPIPVYGSSGVTGYHNEALVQGPAVIVGRKGSVEESDCFPIDTAFYVSAKVPLTFCFYHLQTLGLENLNTDAAVPGLNRNNVYRLPTPWSSDDLRLAFDSIATSIRAKIRGNVEESASLVQTCDLLLPKLMSGEICLRDAEKIAGEAQ